MATLRSALNHLLANALECEDWTRRMHVNHAKYLLAWFGNGPLSGITYPRILEYYREMQRRGLARETVRKYLSTLHMALTESVRMGWLDKVPPWVVIKSDSRPRNDYWTLTQWEAAHLACDDEDFRTMVDVMWWTGMHTSDVYRFRWCDVDLVLGTWVRRNKKSKAEPAVLPLPSRLRSILAARKAELDPHPRDLIVGRNMGHPNRAIKALALRADVPTIRPIGLRHSCSTHLKDQGCDDAFRAHWIGHKPGSTVEKKTYAHVTERQIAAGMALAETKTTP